MSVLSRILSNLRNQSGKREKVIEQRQIIVDSDGITAKIAQRYKFTQMTTVQYRTKER